MTGAATSPKISVILTSYNRAQYLSEAIESIRRQTCSDWELLIVDDASDNPEPRQIAVRYAARDKRIRHIFLARNLGLSAARNSGIRVAQGRYLCFQDDDDISHPRRLEKQLRFLEKNPDAAAVTGRISLCDSQMNKRKTAGARSLQTLPPSPPAADWFRFSVGNIASMIRRDLLLEVGGYRPWFRFVEDWDLNFRLQDRYSVACIPDIAVLYRNHGELRLTNSPLLWHYCCVATICAHFRRTGRQEPIGGGATPLALLPLIKELPDILQQELRLQGVKLLHDAVRAGNFAMMESVSLGLAAFNSEAQLSRITGEAAMYAYHLLEATGAQAGELRADYPLFADRRHELSILSRLSRSALPELMSDRKFKKIKQAAALTHELAFTRKGKKQARKLRRRAWKYSLKHFKPGYWLA